MPVTITKNADGSIVVTAETADEASKAMRNSQPDEKPKVELTAKERFGKFVIPADVHIKGLSSFDPVGRL